MNPAGSLHKSGVWLRVTYSQWEFGHSLDRTGDSLESVEICIISFYLFIWIKSQFLAQSQCYKSKIFVQSRPTLTWGWDLKLSGKSVPWLYKYNDFGALFSDVSIYSIQYCWTILASNVHVPFQWLWGGSDKNGWGREGARTFSPKGWYKG